MNVLFLTQILPYPPNAGPKVKTWHVLRSLVESGHSITLVSFVRSEEEQYVGEVRKLGIDVRAVPIKRSRLADMAYMLKSQVSGRPFLIERDDLSAMRREIDRLAAERTFDVIHADQLTMTQFAMWNSKGRKQPVRVFDAHNATWSIVERMQANMNPLLRPILALEARRIKRYEGQVVNSFEHTLAVTDIDRQLLIEAAEAAQPGSSRQAAERIISIPIAVDTRQLSVVPREGASTNLMTLGTLHYPPNADGIRWFLNEVFPLIRQETPDAALTVIGKNPPADFVQRAAQDPEAVEVTGFVDDLTPYLRRAAVLVVPVRAGGGMRVRILEGFARGIPVVTTTVGLEGIEAVPGRDVLVADTPEEFARAVLCLLGDPALQKQLSENGRRLAETAYDWQIVLRRMDAIYQPG